MNHIRIGNRTITQSSAPFIVAEAGVNHNGEIEKAFEMIEVAKRAGVDAIKFQTFTTEEFVGDSNLMFTYRSQGKKVTESMFAMFKRYEFTRDEWFRIKQRCDDEELLFFSTPQNPSNLALLLEIGVPAIKVGSDDFTNIPLLKEYAKTKLPLLLSCGMADLANVHQALEAVGFFGDALVILLLCTSEYPTPPEHVNLRKLHTLSQAFPGLILGFSDHTQGPLASSLAVACGAVVFEKHFTLDHNLPGPDHWFSEDPQGLEVWVNSIRTAHTMLGHAFVRPTRQEEEIKILAHRSITAIKDIQAGDVLNEHNIGLRKPGNGLPPVLLEKVLGLRANKPLPKNTLISLADLG